MFVRYFACSCPRPACVHGVQRPAGQQDARKRWVGNGPSVLFLLHFAETIIVPAQVGFAISTWQCSGDQAKGASNWGVFERQRSWVGLPTIVRGQPCGVACDFWNRYEARGPDAGAGAVGQVAEPCGPCLHEPITPPLPPPEGPPAGGPGAGRQHGLQLLPPLPGVAPAGAGAGPVGRRRGAALQRHPGMHAQAGCGWGLLPLRACREGRQPVPPVCMPVCALRGPRTRGAHRPTAHALHELHASLPPRAHAPTKPCGLPPQQGAGAPRHPAPFCAPRLV